MDVPAILKQLLADGLTQAELAKQLDTTQTTVSRWLRGDREPMGSSMERIRGLVAARKLSGFQEAQSPYEAKRSVPIMGYIGAGAEIDPDYEQIPADGLDQVELPLLLPENVIGLEVKGDSMLPKYTDGSVIIVHREPTRSTVSLVGEEAAVRTYDGKRYLKVVMPSAKPHTYNLESFNARTIVGVRIQWASEIVAIIPAKQVRHKAQRKSRPVSAKRGAER